MKKHILIITLLALFLQGKAQTTATDFNVKDCAGTDRHLFAELDAGKIVVMSMVHPCLSCVGPTKTAIDVVNSFATSNPGRVIFYLTDDDGGTACNSLNSWASTYSISGVPVISNAAVNQLSYGSTGMPKIVVLGGADHKVYLNQNNSISSAEISNAIQSALTATGLDAVKAPALNIYPNPARETLIVDFSAFNFQQATFEIYSLDGALLKQTASNWKQNNAWQEIDVSGLKPGVYMLMLQAEGMRYPYKFSVAP